MFQYTCYIGVLCSILLVLVVAQEGPSTDASGISEIHVSAKFLAPGKLLDPDLKICSLSNGLPVACTTLEICIKHGQLSQNLYMDVEYTLDADLKIPRLYFLQPEGMFMERQVWPLDNSNTGACVQRLVFLRDDAEDKMSPIAAEVKFSVKPTMNQTNAFTKFSRDVLNISRNCGEDEICEPNLKLDVVPNFPTYIIGSFQLIELGISVANNGEDSFQTYVNITLPEDVAFVNVKMVTDPPVLCYLGNNSKYLLCDVGNPLRTGESVQFLVAFQPIVIDGIAKTLDFAVCLNTSAPADKQKNSEDHIDVSIAVDVSTKLRLEGLSVPEKLTYKKGAYQNDAAYLNEFGPQLVYKYAIANEGLIGIEELDVRIILLNATSDGKDLVYLSEEIETTGVNVTCESGPINPDNYKVESDEEEKWEGASDDEEKPEEKDVKESEEAKSRKRRHIALIPTTIDMIEAGILSHCQEKQCRIIKCKVRELASQDIVTIGLISRVNVRSLKEINPSDPPTVGSVLLAEITKLPFIDRPGYLEVYSKQISTDLVPEED